MKILIIILIIIAFAYLIKLYIDRNKVLKAKKEQDYWMNGNNGIYNFLIDEIDALDFSEQLANLVSYELFKDSCIKKILDNINLDDLKICIRIPDKYSIPDDEALRKYVENAIWNSKGLDSIFAKMFADQVAKNVALGEKEEVEHEKYVKTFGDDSNVELHPNEKNEEEYEVPDSDLDDLYKSGLAEDVE